MASEIGVELSHEVTHCWLAWWDRPVYHIQRVWIYRRSSPRWDWYGYVDSQHRIEGLEDVSLEGSKIGMGVPEFQKGDMVRVIGVNTDSQIKGSLGTIEAYVGTTVYGSHLYLVTIEGTTYSLYEDSLEYV